MCEAFSSRGSDPHKMVARSISARLGGFEWAVHSTFRRRRTLSSTATSTEHLAVVDGSRRRAISCEYDEGYAKSKEEQAKIWERCSIGPTQIQIQPGNAVVSQTKGSKWKRFVQNLKSHVRNWGHHSRPFSHIEYLYSHNNFDDGNCRQIQWTVSNTSGDSVRTSKIAGSASAPNPLAHRIPIWQRRNRPPIPPLHVPNARPSRTKTV